MRQQWRWKIARTSHSSSSSLGDFFCSARKELYSSSCSYFKSSSSGVRRRSSLHRLGAIETPSGKLCVTQKPSTMPSNRRSWPSLATPNSDGRGFSRRHRTDAPDADKHGRNRAPGLSSSRLMLPSQSLNTPPASMPSSPSYLPRVRRKHYFNGRRIVNCGCRRLEAAHHWHTR